MVMKFKKKKYLEKDKNLFLVNPPLGKESKLFLCSFH